MGSEFNKSLSDKVAHIEDILKAFLPKEEGYAKTVIEAMNYSLLAGGKRLRPMMILEAYKLLLLRMDLLFIVRVVLKVWKSLFHLF